MFFVSGVFSKHVIFNVLLMIIELQLTVLLRGSLVSGEKVPPPPAPPPPLFCVG
jgi:hypothetical protein